MLMSTKHSQLSPCERLATVLRTLANMNRKCFSLQKIITK